MTDMRRLRPPPLASSRPRLGGGRSSILAAALCALAASWWLFGARREPSGETAAFPPPADLAGGFEPELAPIEARAGAVGRGDAADGPPQRIPAEQPDADALVDVHGRVLAGGLPVAEQEIELIPLAGTAARGAWDLTDEEGLYAVQLPPGRYGVLLDGDLAPGAILEVASGAPRVRSDLTLANVAPAD